MAAGAVALLVVESVVVAGIAYLMEPAPPERARFRGVHPDIGATGDVPTTPVLVRSKLRFQENQGWVGKVWLCDTADLVRDALGSPRAVQPIASDPELDRWTWGGEGEASRIVVDVERESGHVHRIRYTGTNWETSRGTRAGADGLDVSRAYGDGVRASRNGYRVPRLGIAFETESPGGALTGVEVFLRGDQNCETFVRRADPVAPPEPPAGLREVEIAGVAASSQIPRHAATLAIDGDLATAWTESSEGDGSGEWLELTLARPSLVSRIEVYPGSRGQGRRTGRDLFTANNRPAHVTISIGPYYAVEGDVPDSQEPLVIESGRPDSLPLNPAPSDVVRVVVDRVHRGTTFDDLCITEVRLLGPVGGVDREAHTAPSGSTASVESPSEIRAACRLAATAWNGLAGYQGVRLTRDARGPSAVISRQIGTVYWAGNSPDLSWARNIAKLQGMIGFHLFCENPDASTAYIGLDDDLDWMPDSTLTMARPDVLQGHR
jgi:hypothetical protein